MFSLRHLGHFPIVLNDNVADLPSMGNYAQVQPLKLESRSVPVNDRGVANDKVWGGVPYYFVDLRLAFSTWKPPDTEAPLEMPHFFLP